MNLFIKILRRLKMVEDIMWYSPEDTLQAHDYQIQQQQEQKETKKTIKNYIGDTDGNLGDC